MNKKEMLAVVALFALLIGWTIYTSRQNLKRAQLEGTTNTTQQVVGGTNAQFTAGADTNLAATATNRTETAAETPAAKPTKPQPEPDPEHTPEEPEQRIVLAGEKTEITITSWGGGVAGVQLLDYRTSAEGESDPVTFNFEKPGLSLGGIEGLGTGFDHRVERDGEQSVVVRRQTEEGLQFERRYQLTNNYEITVTDLFVNRGEEPLALPEHSLVVGEMSEIDKTSGRTYGVGLSVDTLSAEDGKKVMQWGKEFPDWFDAKGSGFGCFRRTPPIDTIDLSVSERIDRQVEWAAAKSRFFAQVVRPAGGAKDCLVHADREPSGTNGFQVASVSAELILDGHVLKPGESYTNSVSYYVGPMSFKELSKLDADQDRLMLRSWRFWGWWRACCIGLLWLLNAIHAVIPSYGVAIIILTILVKILMWPLTQKSNANMKRMQQVQPLLTEVREKFKSNPQKMQQKTMEIYREHNVNPVAGCLPMFVQMPVFIALFTVLRSAVELRFAPFLWIKDLSSPEGLIPQVIEKIPFIGPMAGELNILPLLMTATMIWQQRLTPSSGDPQQKKMMMYMPIMFLFLFYKMSSALTLYWTVSQVLSIAQLYWQNKRKQAAA